MIKLTEAELAAQMVELLEEQGWEVFQEVQLRSSRGRADIVARRDPLICVVECKLALGLPVIEQVWEWREYAHLLWVATKSSYPGKFSHKLLRDYGIGWFAKYLHDLPRENIKPTLLRRPPRLDEIEVALTEDRKSHGVAGTNRGGHWTPFRQTCHGLADIVKQNPGITLKEALGKFEHHYSNVASAMSALPEWVEKGKVPGVRFDGEKGNRRLVLVEPDGKSEG